MIALLILGLSGCWKPYDEQATLETSQVPYAVDGLEATDAMITSFDSDLLCPDGSPARIFVVYREEQTQADGIALVFHSGAFDYVIEPDDTDPLDGETWYLDSRLNRNWSTSKIWETLGMLAPVEVDAAESNLGALPAALADANFVQIYPGNCWGDLWHNQSGGAVNDPSEGFERNGYALAWEAVRIALEPNYAAGLGFQIPVQFSGAGLYLVGLGEGGRAVAELLADGDMPPVQGALLDSPSDDLTPYLADPTTFAGEVEGIERIFYGDGADLSGYSLAAIDGGELPEHVAYLWSDLDPRLPAGVAGNAADALASSAWVYNSSTQAHVLSNADAAVADAVVGYLLTGAEPTLDQ